MSNCSSNCPTQDHATYGECLRSKNIHSAWNNVARNLDGAAERKKEAELKRYREARAQGIQPKSTKMKDIIIAEKISDKTGKAFKA